MTKVTKEGAGKFSYHYPFCATIVTSHAEGRDNAMAVAWHAPISVNPPLYGVSISPRRFSLELILQSKAFAINFMPMKYAELVAQTGGSKGSNVDKFAKFNIEKEESIKTNAPVLKKAYAAYECELYDHITLGDHVWCVGKIVAVHYEQEAFNDKDLLDLTKVDPALYISGENYVTTLPSSVRHLERNDYGNR
ncbi:MAG: flavin reductase family protein [Chloroflexi bacterium]|jgi:flavin reductase (DIM6/NTAB) family NADH-FMN oxidoreductase RutF|nr:flavin reductase family protein [Chloroflexota bacterium]MBT7081360.1 flavin reductase family protein [Chloroflexota bacterium]MBT7290668.1 flavin reductase family protein [Chloroflexota bacterium]